MFMAVKYYLDIRVEIPRNLIERFVFSFVSSS